MSRFHMCHSPGSHRPPLTTYLYRREPCQSSCRQSGRRGARSPPTGSNLADRCRPGRNRRLAGLSPPRQRWLGSGAVCRSVLEMEQSANRSVHTRLNTQKGSLGKTRREKQSTKAKHLGIMRARCYYRAYWYQFLLGMKMETCCRQQKSKNSCNKWQ